jgi:2-oxoglutarate dehydrogenase E2 component (dihydrolipoamide succinyltransferase)
LILNTLAEDGVNEEKKEKYIPPKTKQHLSPSVRKIVEEKNIDVSSIEGTEKAGRISKGDLINLMGNIPQPSKRKITHGSEERVKMTRLRLTIAKRLKEAQNNAAMLTTFNEVDMQNIMQMRQDYQEDFQKKYSVKLGFMSFFVKASVVALKNFPGMNAEIENDHIIYKNYYNISIAIGTDRGLVVPVVKKADELSFSDIEKNIFMLSEKARLGKITINDLQGGTFTISNGGIYGSVWSTPILNPPQTGILGMHNIVDRPVVREGQIVIRPVMILALSYDHRIIDGKEAVLFLKTIKECLEEPRRLFLDL